MCLVDAPAVPGSSAQCVPGLQIAPFTLFLNSVFISQKQRREVFLNHWWKVALYSNCGPRTHQEHFCRRNKVLVSQYRMLICGPVRNNNDQLLNGCFRRRNWNLEYLPKRAMEMTGLLARKSRVFSLCLLQWRLKKEGQKEVGSSDEVSLGRS